MDIGDDLNLHHNDIDNVCLKSKTGYESAHEREIWYDQSYNLPAFFDGEKKVILADNAKKENNLPVAPTNPETYFLNANKEWSEIQIGNGGFAANLYFTTKDSDVTGYKKIEYTAEATETELSGTLTNQEALFRTYLFDSPIKTTIIDAGAWIGTFRVKVSGTEGVTQLKFEAFVRHVDNTETVLFSYYSTEINNTNYLTIKNESHQPSYVVHATDRLGVKISGKTTHPAPITIYTIIGDGNASYFTTPLSIRHNQLRDLNGDDNYLHVTSTEKSTWNAKQDALTFSADIEADKTSTTKVSAIKTFYDWAVGKFVDLSKIVTTWSATPLDTNLASEKLVKDEFNAVSNIHLSLFADGINVNKDNGLLTVGWLPTNVDEGASFNVSQITDSISPFVGFLTKINQCSLTRTSGANCFFSKRIDNILTELISEISLLSYSYWIKDSEWTGLGASELTIKNWIYGGIGYNLEISYDLLRILNEETVTGTKTESEVTCTYEIKSGSKLSGWTQIIVNWKNINWITTPSKLSFYTLYNPIVSYLYGKTWHIQNNTILINSEVLEGLFIYRDGGTVEGNLGEIAIIDDKIAIIDDKIVELEEIIQGVDYGSFNYNSEIDQLSYILTNYNETNYLKQTFKISRNSADNECFNFVNEYLVNKSTLSETLIKGSTDDICPANFNGTYIGANHGVSTVGKITCALHGKTFVDIGSKWTNGTNNFYIINIVDANSLWVLGENLSGTDIWNFALISGTSGTLTHVENATHTGNIVFTNSEVAQLKPANKIISRSIYADNKLIETSGTYNFNELNINEEYNILDPSSVLNKIIAAVGTFTANPVYNDLDADPVVRMSLNYKYKDEGTCLITTNFITYKDITIGYFGFIQAIPMYNNTKLYIPKALPISGKDFREIEDWGTATYITDNLTSEYWENAELPPDRFIFSDGTRGFTSGFLYDYGVGGDNKKNNINNSLFLYLSGKIYPHGIDNKLTIGAGEGYSATCFRKHLTEFNTDGIIGLTKFEHEDKYYIYADFNAIGIYEIEVPNDYIGKSINIFEKSDNITVLSDITTGKLLIKVENASPLYGYAVIKITNNEAKHPIQEWRSEPSNENVVGEKLLSDTFALKADVSPANGATSALRALFIARGYYKQTNTYYCVYNDATGYYEMNGLTDLTEAQMADIYINTAVQINIGIGATTSFTCMSYSNIRTSFPRTSVSGYDDTNDMNRFLACNKLEVYKNYEIYGHMSYSCYRMFYRCSKLHTVDFLSLSSISNATYVADCFTGCVKLVTAYLKSLKVSFSFKDCPLLSLASLQYLVTNRANGTSTITITVHETVWEKLDDAENYSEWNDLLVEAGANHIDFAYV